jgi:hypothetical protein
MNLYVNQEPRQAEPADLAEFVNDYDYYRMAEFLNALAYENRHSLWAVSDNASALDGYFDEVAVELDDDTVEYVISLMAAIIRARTK